jgi:hypothetical protein
MNEKDPTKFRIRIDDESPDTGFEEGTPVARPFLRTWNQG